MPREYEEIRDSLVSRGVGYDKAQSIAAGKYNKRHPGSPITGKSETRSRSNPHKRNHRVPPQIMRYGR